jgi:hypothetical protein
MVVIHDDVDDDDDDVPISPNESLPYSTPPALGSRQRSKTKQQ